MSTSDIYAVYRTTARHMAEFRNGHGTAPLVWGYLNRQFLGRKDHEWLFGNNEPLWKLVSDARVPMSVRIVHAWCMDGAICKSSRVAELAEACSETGKICAVEKHVNHWQAISDALKTYKSRYREIGLGISCTSVCDPWISWPKGEYRGEPWDLFAAISTDTPGGR